MPIINDIENWDIEQKKSENMEVEKDNLKLKRKIKEISTWQASLPASPPAQKLDAGRMNIFSVTAFIFLTHSVSLTTGSSASLTLRGMGPLSPI